MGVRGVAAGFVAGAVVAGLVAAGMASAAIPSSGGVVTACVNKSSGAVRIIDAEARRRCTSAERTVTWARDVARGAWSASAAYAAGDTVQYGGSTWQARRASKGRAPAAGANWTLLAAAGAPGPQGAQGPQGPQGVQGAQGPAGPTTGTYAESVNVNTVVASNLVTFAATDAYEPGLPGGGGAWFGPLPFPGAGSLFGTAAVEVTTTNPNNAMTCVLEGKRGNGSYVEIGSDTAANGQSALRFTEPFIRFSSPNGPLPEQFRVRCNTPGPSFGRTVDRARISVQATFRPN